MTSNQAVLNMQWNAANEAVVTEQARRAPHVLLSPRIFPDGNQWCALLGENLHEGISGFGDTPEKACADFDSAFRSRLPPGCHAEQTDTPVSEPDGFRLEAAEQCGFRITDPDGSEYACTVPELLMFARACERAALVKVRNFAAKVAAPLVSDVVAREIAEIDAELQPFLEAERNRHFVAAESGT